MHAAYRLQTPRVRLIAPDPARAVDFLRCAEASVPALKPIMDWAHDLPDEDGIIELVRSWRAMFDRDADRHYLLIERATDTVIGACGIHPRVKGKARELGYWMRSDRAGQGLMTEAVGAVVRAEFATMGWDRLDVYVEPDNPASIRVAQKLGFARIAELPAHIPWAHGPDHDAVVLSLFRTPYLAGPLPTAPVRAWDVAGRPLELPALPST